MKLLSLAALLLPLSLLAATYRVNNAPDTSPDYSTIQAAIDAAVDGDTILIEGSTAVYAPFTLTNKRLNLIGPGYGLTTNLGTPANKLGATISGGTSYVRTSSTSGGSANGTLVMSLAFPGELRLDGCSNVTVARCLFSGGSVRLMGPGNTVTQSFFPLNGFLFLNDGSSGARIENNIFTYDAPFFQSSNGAYTLKNNVMRRLNSSSLSLILDNNIFAEYFAGSFENSVFRNNLFFQSVPNGLTGSGNLAYSAVTTVMANNNSSGGPSQPDRNYQLLPLSAANPAYNTGTDGTHIGPFGGANPYILSGVPPLPSIDELSVPQFAAPGGNLTIRVKVSERP
jgi:hypothetical protein